MEKDFEDIIEKIDDLYYNNKIGNLEDVEKQLSEIIGTKMVCYDTTIDDGIDDDCEDEYIMKSCFSDEDDKIIVRIYYGNNSDVVTDYSIDYD